MEKISYESTTEFNKDLKKLCKKYRTLEDDIEVLKKASIELYHLQSLDSNGIFPIPSFCSEDVISLKVKKIASKSFKSKGSNTGLRLIYIFIPKELKIVFIEIYYKGVKENEDKERLKYYYNNLLKRCTNE